MKRSMLLEQRRTSGGALCEGRCTARQAGRFSRVGKKHTSKSTERTEAGTDLSGFGLAHRRGPSAGRKDKESGGPDCRGAEAIECEAESEINQCGAESGAQRWEASRLWRCGVRGSGTDTMVGFRGSWNADQKGQKKKRKADGVNRPTADTGNRDGRGGRQTRNKGCKTTLSARHRKPMQSTTQVQHTGCWLLSISIWRLPTSSRKRGT